MFELTTQQYDIWTTEQIAGNAAVMLTGSILYDKKAFPYSTEEMVNAVKRMIRLNDALRIRLIHGNTVPMQTVTDIIPESIDMIRFESHEAFRAFAEETASEPLDPNGPLYRFLLVDLPEQKGLFVRLHHLISDAWTLSLVGSQFSALVKNEQEIEAYSYVDHVKKESAMRESPRNKRDLDFFAEQYEKNSNLLLLGAGREIDYQANRQSFWIEPQIKTRLYHLAESTGASVFSILMALYSVYFSRTEMNAASFYLGTTLLNRYGAEDQNTMGMYVNTVPVAIELVLEQSFEENLKQVQTSVFKTMRHGRCTYTDILRRIRSADPSLRQLFDVSINFHNAQLAGVDNLPFQTEWYPSKVQTEALQISVEDRDRTGGFFVHYDFRTDCFNEQSISRLHRAIETLINCALEDPTCRISDMKLMPDAEYQWALHQVNQSPWPYTPENIGSWFKETASRYGDHIAVEASDGCLSYQQLNTMTDQLAAALVRKGIHTGDCIALLLERRSNLPVMMMAVLKAGAAFLLLDREYPQDRIDFMVSNCKAAMIIEDKDIPGLLSLGNVKEWQPMGQLSDLCYLIYTSGSTGTPKGVQITQRSIVNNIFWRLKAYPDRNRRIICVSGVTADTFLEDYFYALFSGNTLCLVEERRNLADIRRMVGSKKNNDIMTTPTFFSVILTALPFESFGNVTLVGENLDEDLAEQILSHGLRLHNEYGPSECAICATHALLTSRDIHIGYPIDNAQILILDRFLQPVPMGVKGELCIAGMLVGNGYLGLPELTRERFLENYHGFGPLYRTGDVAYWREDGNIALVGRIDNQIKIRGLRVELEEIEKELNNLLGITNSAVTVHKGKSGQQMLCAFYTGELLQSDQIMEQLGKKLPPHMVPQILIHLDQMPMSNNSKIDRKALPVAMIDSVMDQTVYIEPQTWQEQIMCRIAGELLEIPRYGLNHHFFQHGGDSLKAMEFVSRAVQEGVQINLQMVFNHPTIQGLSDELSSKGKTKVSYTLTDFCQIHQMLSAQSDTQPGPYAELNGVLITGSTGFLGAQLASMCLKLSKGPVWFVVRGKDRDLAQKRFEDSFDYYYGNQAHKSVQKRARVICGDLSLPRFGLSESEYEELLQSIRLIIHAAGNVKHFGPYQEFYEGNVLPVKHLVDFCKENGAKLIHCSTTSILGGTPAGKISFDEHDFYVGQPLENVYIHSKFEAERIVLDAAAQGLPVRVVRIGNLTNRNSDMKFQQNPDTNAFLQRACAIARLGAFPAELGDIKIDFTPADLAAQAILAAAHCIDYAPYILHVINPYRVSISELLRIMNETGIPVRMLPNTEFADIIRRNNVIEFVNDMDAEGKISFSEEKVSCKESCRWLSLAGFRWPTDIEAYIRKYVQYYQSIGYWKH